MSQIKLLKSGELSEESIHKTIMDWVKLQPLIKDLVLHFPNEGKRNKRYGKFLKDLGMRAGVSDLFIMMGRHGYNGAWIELKSTDGILSPFQQQFIADARKQNYFTAVCRSFAVTIQIIKWYCFEDS